MKKVLYTFIWFIFISNSYAAWNDPFWTNKITQNLQHWWDDLIFTVDNMLWYLIGLFYFVAVAIWIYGSFLILVSGWDEEKVKKWKNFLIYMVLWLVLVFLASIIVNWVINVMSYEVI